ncbi:MAG: hypothetical protein H0V89_04600 [Deltaproteobacteria bacterium]|nr:hypothetical protein [Deltaproteobacteria bacterium]
MTAMTFLVYILALFGLEPETRAESRDAESREAAASRTSDTEEAPDRRIYPHRISNGF